MKDTHGSWQTSFVMWFVGMSIPVSFPNRDGTLVVIRASVCTAGTEVEAATASIGLA